MNDGSCAAPIQAPYGTWRSSIGALALADQAVRLGDTALDGDALYWIEQRPSENGRSVVCRITMPDAFEVLTPTALSARSRVHEYGGGALAVHQGVIYFVDDQSQQIYRQPLGQAPVAMSHHALRRYADLSVDAQHARLLAVAEQHHADGREPENFLVALSLEAPYTETVLHRGHDFYAAPRAAPNGLQLAFCAWNHPDMPWESSTVWLCAVGADGALSDAQAIAGGAEESAIEPRFSGASELWFVSDRSGFWNLYRWQGGVMLAVYADAAEYGRAPWVFGGCSYALLDTGHVVAVREADGQATLLLIDPATGVSTALPVPYSELSQLRVSAHGATFIGASALDAPALVHLDLVTGHLTVLHRSTALVLGEGEISTPEAITYPSADRATAHALFYAPRNTCFLGVPGERAPLIVMSHGGPTSAARASLNPAIQFWTSRGFAVVDVNYRGSTGYGRAYREALSGAWGVADVDDCVYAARYLEARGDVDGARMAIRGGSAGGYTTLCALAFRQVFRAGASYYGIGDLSALARDTHKFESRYLERLIGPYPQARALYEERSPLLHLQGFNAPLLLLQGLEDKVVPAAQSNAVYEALRARGVPVAYLVFPGEQHGFRQAANIRRSIEAELYFYGRVFGFTPADRLEPIDIEHLPAPGLGPG